MEALGVASSIAGLVTLAEVIVIKISRYYAHVKHARSDVKELLSEVQSLYGVLASLKVLAACLEDEDDESSKTMTGESDSQDSESGSTHKFSNLGHFQTCRNNLDILKKALGKIDDDFGARFSGLKARLHWPLQASETKAIIEKVAKSKRALSDALTADGLYVVITLSHTNR